MKKKNENESDVKKKLEYIGLDLDNVPETLKIFEPLNYRTSKTIEGNRYKQYRYVPIKDIEILLSPTNRLNTIEEKYSKASPIYTYLVPDEEENIIKHANFLQMLKKVKIEDIEKIEEEQKVLNTRIPFRVKYPGNYLWQIYYSENADKYFMLVPIEDSDYSAFFYLLKKQLEKRKIGKIFIPISGQDYSREFFTKSEIEDIENYIWLFTKDWPSIYEIHDKTEKTSFQIVGETEVYENIKTPYKVTLKTKENASQFYKLLKALFILQTQLPHYYKFETNINSNGELELYFNNKQITYEKIGKFINSQYIKLIKNEEEKEEEITKSEKRLQILQEQVKQLEAEYIAKEKQISTYLEYKKTFLGKVKYFIKYSKKVQKNTIQIPEEVEDEVKDTIQKKETEEIDNEKRYTLEDLVEKSKEYEVKENKHKKLVMDINAIKLRIKNITKKIENATKFIEEIDKHKRSIFEFWKYANKDELASLPEGEEEVISVEPQIKRKFSYKDDIEKIGEYLDTLQRKELTREELESIYIGTTSVIEAINSLMATKETARKETENSLKNLKENMSKDSQEKEEFDIFGGLIEDNRKIKTIANKSHREIARDIYNILGISKTTKITEYKFELDRIIKNIKNAITKIKTNQNLIAYKAIDEELNPSNINVFDLNLEKEIKEVLESTETKINLYKIEIEKDTNLVGFTNNVFYDNKNNTLPIGMDLSTKVMIYDTEIVEKISQKPSKTFKIAYFEENKDELSKVKIKTVNVYE